MLDGGISGDVDENTAPLGNVEVGEGKSAVKGQNKVLVSTSLVMTCAVVA